MKVRVLVRPTGCYNGSLWPEVGETMDLDDATAEGMVAAGHLEPVAQPRKVEKRPAVVKAETRKRS